MATVWVFIRTTTKAKANVRFRVTGDNGEIVFHTSEITVLPDQWDKKGQCIKAKVLVDTDERANFNKAVADRKELLRKIAESTTEPITSQWLDEQVDRAINPAKYRPEIEEYKPSTLFEWVEAFIETAPQRTDKATGRQLAYNNIQQYRATQKHLKAFATCKRKKDFEFDQIDQKFYDDFVKYLQGLEFTANSTGKHIRVLKLMLNEATKQNINTSTKYSNFHVFTEETDTIYLNEIELQQLKDIDLSNTPHLDRVRDWFLLLCWTGCRFSDLAKVGQTDIKDGFISFRQQKTNTRVTIPMHPVVMEVLQKYDFNLPEPISNQKFNEYIKEVAQRAGLDTPESITKTVGGTLQTTEHPKFELISTHTGRRSFCTNMYKRGLPTLMIMSISGHKTEKSFLKYIKIKQEEHAQMMQKAWAEMYKQ